ncbi:hypothetical protein EDD85DRAFT_849035 [Armillaria nabsnona]|nr:hypothetical protein EDD85DRAFT_849035 [Armillaria nabsnona]
MESQYSAPDERNSNESHWYLPFLSEIVQGRHVSNDSGGHAPNFSRHSFRVLNHSMDHENVLNPVNHPTVPPLAGNTNPTPLDMGLYPSLGPQTRQSSWLHAGIPPSFSAPESEIIQERYVSNDGEGYSVDCSPIPMHYPTMSPSNSSFVSRPTLPLKDSEIYLSPVVSQTQSPSLQAGTPFSFDILYTHELENTERYVFNGGEGYALNVSSRPINSMGPGNPLLLTDHSMMHPNWARNSLVSSPSTLDTDNIFNHSDSDIGIAPGTSVNCSPSTSRAPTDAIDISHRLIKPPPKGYQPVQDSSSREWTAELGGYGIGPESVIYYSLDPPETLHPCSVGQCVEEFRWNEIHEHLITKHRGISNHPDVTCNTCRKTIKARSYKEHFLDLHSGRSFCCAYCNGTLSRMRKFPNHFKKCPGLTQKNT